MPNPQKYKIRYVKNKDVLLDALKLLKEKSDAFSDKIKDLNTKLFDSRSYSGRAIDSRDLILISYLLLLEDPNMTNDKYVEKAKEIVEAFTYHPSQEFLHKHAKATLDYAKQVRDKRLGNIDQAKLDLEKVTKGGYSKNTIEKHRKLTTVDSINKMYNDLENILNKDNIDFNEYKDALAQYQFDESVYTDIYLDSYKQITKNASKYLKMLFDFSSSMPSTIDKLDSNNLVDCMKLLISAFSDQTISVKSKEFASFIENNCSSKYEFIEFEKKIDETSQLNYYITKDLINLDVNGNDYVPVTLMHFTNIARSNEKNLETKGLGAEADTINQYLTKGEINLEMKDIDYKMASDCEKVFKNRLIERKDLNSKENKYFSTFKSNLTKGIISFTDGLKKVLSDSLISSNIHLDNWFNKVYIDGVRLDEFTKVKENEKTGYGKVAAEMVLLEKIAEGNHYIAYSKIVEYQNEIYNEIIPIKVKQDPKKYFQSKGFFYKLTHLFSNKQKLVDKLLPDQEKIEKYNKVINKDFEKITETYKTRFHITKPVESDELDLKNHYEKNKLKPIEVDLKNHHSKNKIKDEINQINNKKEELKI